MALPSLPALILLLSVGYLVSLAVRRLCLSPLAKFPGPKLAALTRWYEAYYEIVLQGQFTFHIEDLHRQYGPIVRIAPEEIHIQDPPFWDTLYAKHHKSSKYEWMAGRFGNSGSVFTTSDPALHRLRRAPLNNMFSRRAIMDFEPVVQQKMAIFVQGLMRFQESGGVCKISEAFSAFAGDVVTNYCFGFDYDHLGLEGFPDSFHGAFMAVSAFSHTALQFPWIHSVLNMLPPEWNKAMNPPLAKLLDLQRDLRDKIMSIRKDVEGGGKAPEHPTIFHTLLRSDLPEPERSDLRLAEEAQLFIGAGIETTAWALCQAVYYILSSSTVLRRLKSELREAIPDPSVPDAFRYTALEALPYLGGYIKEAIRLSLSVSARNPRLLPEPLVWREWVIPAQTPISMTIADVHLNDDYFPKATEFKPERWMGNAPRAPDGSLLEKYFVAFGKGPRTCIGINLAYMELFVVLATLFRKFDLELHETDVSDVLLAHDFFLPSPKLDSKGIRVRVLGTQH